MKADFKKLFHVLPLFFGSAARERDHKKLTRHIIDLNQENSARGIIQSVSACLKDILGYRLFAFVIQKECGIDVWLDPRMYRKSLESVLLTDFNLSTDDDITYLNHNLQNDPCELEFDLDQLVYYDLCEGTCIGRIYMLPNRNAPSHHDEIVHMLLKSTGIALAKQMNIDELTNAATRDPLTGCYNRREFERQIKNAVAASKRHNSDLSVFMFDIDHFKKVNDTYGHQAGDMVLKAVAELVQRNMRTHDILARYGGEEFIAVLPSTEKREAIELAERLRKKIEKSVVSAEGKDIRITASFGISCLTSSYNVTDGSDITSLIEEADSMLYKAKRNGRNAVMPGRLTLLETHRQEMENVHLQQDGAALS